MRHKDALEGHLRQGEGQLFSLKETIILYDLTNTFFESSGAYNPKARYGKSTTTPRRGGLMMALKGSMRHHNDV